MGEHRTVEHALRKQTILLIALAVWSTVAFGAEPDASQSSRAVGLDQLAAARNAEAAANFARAEELLRSAVETKSLQKPELDQIETELKQVRTALQQSVELNAIERMIDRGRGEEAEKRLTAMLGTASNALIIARIDKLLAKDPPFFPPLFDRIWSWTRTLLPIGVAVLVILWLRWMVFQTVLADRQDHWRLMDVTDSTGRNGKELIAHYFSYWARRPPNPVTSGLLVGEASYLPVPTPLDLQPDKYDIAKSLAAVDLKVWGLSLSSLFNLFAVFSRWFVPQPREISGIIYIDENKRFCARLVTSFRERDGKPKDATRIIAVSAIAEGSPEDALRRAAEEVTFKMIYALAREGDVLAAESDNDMRSGVQMLQSYLSANGEKDDLSPWDCLEGARGTFERIRKARPELLEAHVYEGIALDLLERHKDAAAHFDFVKQATKGANGGSLAGLHERAVYNGAVARLRNMYELEGIKKAIEQFQQMIAGNLGLQWAVIEELLVANSKAEKDEADIRARLLTPLLERPLATLALATLADAWANRTIHWKALKTAHETDEAGLLRVVAENERNVIVKTAAVNAVLHLAHDEAKQQKFGWDITTLRQVQWAYHNARGDFYLYAAVPLKRATEQNPMIVQQYTDFLEKALDELRQCEMLLPAGVETLSNIGTLHLIRGEVIDLALARQYLQRAIALNPHYEYAYYRLAQSWETDQRRDNVIEVLKSFPNPPQISSFRAMYSKYFVEPKSEFAA